MVRSIHTSRGRIASYRSTMSQRKLEPLQEAQFRAELYKPRRPTYELPPILWVFAPLAWLVADMLLEYRRAARRR